MAAALPARTSLSALKQVPQARLIRASAGVLAFLLVGTVLAMGFAPWQQTAVGKGRVIAFAPLERQQTVKSPIKGIVDRWGEGVVEGARVEKGQFLCEIRNQDPLYLERLELKVEAVLSKLETAQKKALLYEEQVQAYTLAREMTQEAGEKLVSAAGQKVAAEQQALRGAQAEEMQLKLDWDRQRQLAAEGIASGLKAQEAEAKWRFYHAKVEQHQSYVAAAQADLEAKQAELVQKVQKAETEVSYALAQKQSALGEAAAAEKELQDARADLSQFSSRSIEAPRDGVIYRILVAPESDVLKEGDPLLIIVPDTVDRAVELWVSGNDMPLVEPGRHVRLQFEGWPSLQFTGWPAVAVGTFGGEVITVDPTDNGKGEFRVLIKPDPAEPAWPSERFLRQGVRANGWVLLNEVTVGYEIWRQLNGFPPVISTEEPKDGKDDIPKVKLPK